MMMMLLPLPAGSHFSGKLAGFCWGRVIFFAVISWRDGAGSRIQLRQRSMGGWVTIIIIIIVIVIIITCYFHIKININILT